MEENEKKQEETKPTWQQTKESWYDKVPLTVKQLDIIIWGCVAALVVVVILILKDVGVL